jgi:hypothetical protein
MAVLQWDASGTIEGRMASRSGMLLKSLVVFATGGVALGRQLDPLQ